jgi:hypothetical protein
MSLKYANIFLNIMYSNTIEQEDIASSIRRHSLLQPIILRTKGDHFEVIGVSQQKIFSLQIFGLEKKLLAIL